MTITLDQLAAVLDNDPNTREGLRIINAEAARLGLSSDSEEYLAAREYVLLASALHNNQARQILSDSIWDMFNRKENKA